MAVEIERKFLVANDTWRAHAGAPTLLKQAYLSVDKARTVRVRIENDQGYLTIKGLTQGISRAEFEYAIALADAEQLLLLCLTPVLEKYRYRIPCADHVWEVDEFLGVNQGLLIAEIELSDVAETFVKPSWLGEEVSQQAKYYNSALSQTPYSCW